MKHFFSLLTFSVLTLVMLSSTKAQTTKVTLNGHVKDSLSGSPLPFATIELSGQSAKFQGTTDETGRFQINGLDTGAYTVSVNYIGYTPVSNFILHLHQSAEVLEIAMTQQPKTLNGVVVIASKPLITMRSDKIIVNVEQSPMAASENIYQTIKRSPGVMDMQGLKLRGKTVTVYVNGRPLRLAGQELENYLSAIPANTVESLELMPNPSAKYEASGAAIINIVLAKNKNLGTNGTLNVGTGVGHHLLYNGGVSLNYRTEKFNVYGSYDYMHSRTDAENTTTRYISQGLTVNDLQSVNNNLNSHTYKLGFDQTLSKRSSWGMLIRGNFNQKETDMNNNSLLSGTALKDDSSSRLFRENTSRIHTPSANVYFKTLIGKQKNELSFNADYFNYDKNWNNNMLVRFYDENKMEYGTPQLVRSLSPANNQVLSFNGDYSFKVTKLKFETGVKSIFTKTDNDLLWETFNQNNWEKDNNRSNRFIYKENIHAAYLNGYRSYGKFDLQAGLRAEYTENEGNSVTLQQIKKNDYISFFPSLSVGFNLSEKQQYSASYSRKIERFGFDIVNPFLVYQSQYQYYQGNPAIRPSYSHNVDLSWMYNNSWMANISYSKYKDALAEVYRKDENNITIGSFDNVSGATQVLAGLSYNKGFLNGKIYTSVNLNGLYAKYNAGTTTNLDNSTIAIMASNSTIYKPADTWKTELSISYSSPWRFGAYDFKSQFYMGMGVSKTILQKKGTLTLNVSDIFNTNKSRYQIESYNVLANQRNNPETRFLKLTFSYKFGNQQVKAARNRRTSMDEMKNRMGN